MQLYTPFLADVGKTIGNSLAQKMQNELITNAYMNKPGAMEQLMRVNPEAAQKIRAEKVNKEQQDLQNQRYQQTQDLQQQKYATEQAQYAEQANISAEDRKAKAQMELQKIANSVKEDIAKFDNYDQAKAYYDQQVNANQELINIAGVTPKQLEFTPQYFEQVKKIGSNSGISPELQQAVKDGKLKPESLNKNTLPIFNTLAKNGALTGEGKTANDDLIEALRAGTIDPNKVNSRTVQIFNDLASAKVNAVKSSADIKGKTEAYKDSIKYAGTTFRVSHVLDKNMPLIYDLADKVNMSGIPILDKGFTSIQAKATNNPDVIKYVNTLKTLRAEYANMLAKGNQVTESMRDEATEAIPSGLSTDGYKALGEQLTAEVKNIMEAANETADAIQFGKPGEAIKEQDQTNVPKAAIEYLKANPNLKDQFEAKYGKGSAASVLGQ